MLLFIFVKRNMSYVYPKEKNIWYISTAMFFAENEEDGFILDLTVHTTCML